MKKIISTLFLTTGLLLSAQVGINTNTPKAMLDVNGDVNFRNKIAFLMPIIMFPKGIMISCLFLRDLDIHLSGNHFVFRNMRPINFT